MAKSVLYSFRYDRDVHRVQLFENINALEGQPVLNTPEWETVRRGGQTATRVGSTRRWLKDGGHRPDRPPERGAPLGHLRDREELGRKRAAPRHPNPWALLARGSGLSRTQPVQRASVGTVRPWSAASPQQLSLRFDPANQTNLSARYFALKQTQLTQSSSLLA